MSGPPRSKLGSANLLVLGMEGLRPGGLVPVSQAAIRDAGSPEAALERQRIGAALTNAVLYTIVVELVLKHIWEQEHGTAAEHTHDVLSIFGGLSSQTRRDVEALYDTCCGEYRAAVDAGQREHGPEAVAVDMANLDEALQWNQQAVKNLKYELTPHGRSVPTGMFWSSDNMWVLPPQLPNFAIELTRWANRRTFRKLEPQRGSQNA